MKHRNNDGKEIERKKKGGGEGGRGTNETYHFYFRLFGKKSLERNHWSQPTVKRYHFSLSLSLSYFLLERLLSIHSSFLFNGSNFMILFIAGQKIAFSSHTDDFII